MNKYHQNCNKENCKKFSCIVCKFYYTLHPALWGKCKNKKSVMYNKTIYPEGCCTYICEVKNENTNT